MPDPDILNSSDHPIDPRGGFNSNEGCIEGTPWGSNVPLDGSTPEASYAPWQGHSTGGTGGSVTVAE